MKTTHTSGQLVTFLNLLEQKGVTPDEFQKRLQSGVLADIFDPASRFDDRDSWRMPFGLDPLAPKSGFLTVKNQTLVEMIRSGRYGWFNEEIVFLFHTDLTLVGEWEFRYFVFDERVTTEDALLRIENEDPDNKWCPAKIDHLLSLGAAYPEAQKKGPILALGSRSFSLSTYVSPILNYRDGKRYVNKPHDGGNWDPEYRFLAVRRRK